jgi:hypothetical protein
MFSPSRDQARRFFYDTWGRYERGETLTGCPPHLAPSKLLRALCARSGVLATCRKTKAGSRPA